MKTYVEHEHTLVCEDRTIPKDMDSSSYKLALLECSTGRACIVPYVKPPKTPKEAWAEGAAYVTSKINTLQLIKLSSILSVKPSNPKPKHDKIIAVLEWIETLESEAMTNPETFVPSGEPPYTYEDIMAEEDE